MFGNLLKIFYGTGCDYSEEVVKHFLNKYHAFVELSDKNMDKIISDIKSRAGWTTNNKDQKTEGIDKLYAQKD